MDDAVDKWKRDSRVAPVVLRFCPVVSGCAELHSARHRGPSICFTGDLGKIHVATLWRRRVVTQCNRWVCNLTPGRAFAIALPTESLFKKERDEFSAPDSVTPLQKNPAFSLAARPSIWIGINEWNTGEYRQTSARGNSLSNLPARRNLCRAWHANQHEFDPLELGLKLVQCVKRQPVSSAPFTKESRCD